VARGKGGMTTLLTLLAGTLIGYLAQRSRFCMFAPIRDFLLTHDWRVWEGVLTLLGVSFFLYSVSGYFHWITWDFPAWSVRLVPLLVLAALAGVGLGLVSAWVGGCPTRQHVRAAQGDGDATLYLLGFYAGILIYYLLTTRLLAWIL
jgi:uncharacterized protein